MEEMKVALAEWGETLTDVHLPRWHELPDIELYMDQVITLIERYLSPLITLEKHTLLTSSMVNNYVKQGLIPPPVKKRYNRKHIAFLIAITLLKQVLTIPEIKQGILFQGAVVGIRQAYNSFCEEQENAITAVAGHAQGQEIAMPQEATPAVEYMAVKAATLSFATKMFSEKVIELEQEYLSKNGRETV
jgi:DNA-binding transcriptional MerR regulator